MHYIVDEFRNAGLQAKWSKTGDGAPIIIVKNDQAKNWMYADASFWDDCQEMGIQAAYEKHGTLIDFFSIRL